MKSARILWRWAERDFGFRFQQGTGKRSADYYQAGQPGEFYHVPAGQRKLDKARIEELAALMAPPTAPTVVAIPWRDYSNPDHQQITTQDNNTCLNWAGCPSADELKFRETNGVNRAKAFVADLAQRDEPVPITLDLIQRIHGEMFEDIYPWAGKWRTVSLHKGDGPTRWPLPPFGMEPVMEDFARDVLAKTPFLSEEPEEVLAFTAQLMGDYLTLHPFREGNGRSAFILSELVLFQNGLLAVDDFNRKRDQARYFAACDAARLCDYGPLTLLLIEWEAEAQRKLEEKLNEGGAE
jgi:cell filamentation protein